MDVRLVSIMTHLASTDRTPEHMADLITQKSLPRDRGHVDVERDGATNNAHVRLTRMELLLLRSPLTEFKKFDEMFDSMTQLHSTSLPGLLPVPEFPELPDDQQQHGDRDQQKPHGDQLKHKRRKQDMGQLKHDSSDVYQKKIDERTGDQQRLDADDNAHEHAKQDQQNQDEDQQKDDKQQKLGHRTEDHHELGEQAKEEAPE